MPCSAMTRTGRKRNTRCQAKKGVGSTNTVTTCEHRPRLSGIKRAFRNSKARQAALRRDYIMPPRDTLKAYRRPIMDHTEI